MSDALVNHPEFGCLWLSDAHLVRTARGDYVVGCYWDTSDAGSPFMPDDFFGMDVLMNFPAACIRKTVGEPLTYRALVAV